jgi:phospholipid/cholesterol/gamma-HCH transport system ATP-binding protein
MYHFVSIFLKLKMIKISNLHKSFGKKKVLTGVNLEIPTGETMCIIGKSGCGKSVLLKNIVGLLYPDEGSVMVDEHNIANLTNQELFFLRQKMGYVFQGSALFDSYNVYENIIIGLYEHGERDDKKMTEEALRVLSAVQLLPPLDERGSEEFEREWSILKDKSPSDLSGGMKKRVGVARALVGNPEYIFYDEPTTGLDPVTSEQIDQLIAHLSKNLNVTSLVITHDMFSVFRIANSIAMLNNGIVQFEGSVDELRDSRDKDVLDFLERYAN